MKEKYEDNKSYWIALVGGLGFAIILSFIVWDLRLHMWNWRLDSKQNLLWTVVLKAVAGYVSVLSAVVTAFKYIDEKSRQREQDLKAELRQKEQVMREDRKDFLKQRQDVYKRLGRSLAGIMNHDPDDPNDHDWDKMKENFYCIFWGELRLVADQKVLSLVEDFQTALYKVSSSEEKKALSDQVMKISDACRESLGDSWRDIRKDERASADSILLSTSGEQPEIPVSPH